MKKILIALLCFFLVTGCGKSSEEAIINDLNKKISNLSSYSLSGKLEIINNDDVYNYDIDVSYKKQDTYKVILTNVSNNHTQIILKNEDGVYVLTPSLNKSFKFQSDWPYNNSQIYLLDALLRDIKTEEDREFSNSDSGYVFKTSVRYPNNSKLLYQKIVFDKKLNLKKATVYDSNDVSVMSFSVKNLKYDINFDEGYFNLDSIMSFYDNISSEDVSNLLDDSIYPLVIPSGTTLASEEKIKKDVGERIILTFDGDKPFLLVEETANVESEFTIIPTYGEPYQLMDTLGVMTSNSLSWTSNGIEYYIVSDVLTQSEMIEVAQSICILPTMK